MFVVEEDGIKIIPLVTAEEIKANIGFLGTKGKLLKAFMKEKKRERGDYKIFLDFGEQVL